MRGNTAHDDLCAQKSEHSKFMAAWAWKREHLPDKLRFYRPYRHPLDASAETGASAQELIIHQGKFEHEGFASTGEAPPALSQFCYSQLLSFTSRLL